MQFEGVLRAVWGQKMHITTGAETTFDFGFKGCFWQNMSYPHPFGLVAQGSLWACPYHIIHGDFVTHNPFFSRLDINYGCKPGFVKSKIIQKCTVLAEMIGIIGVVHACFFVAQKEQQAL